MSDALALMHHAWARGRVYLKSDSHVGSREHDWSDIKWPRGIREPDGKFLGVNSLVGTVNLGGKALCIQHRPECRQGPVCSDCCNGPGTTWAALPAR